MRPLLLVFGVLLGSCATGDLGTPCEMPQSVKGGDPTFDYLFLDTTECDDLVCLQRKGTTTSFCSRGCLEASDCALGFECVQLVPSVPIEGVDARSYCSPD